MSYHFRGISEYVDRAAADRGFDPSDATDPRHLLVSAARANRLMTQVGDSLGQAAGAAPEHKAEVSRRAVQILWQIGVMRDAAAAAILELFAAEGLDTSELTGVIDHGTGHGHGDDDHGVGHDMVPAQGGRPEGRPRQPGRDQRGKG